MRCLIARRRFVLAALMLCPSPLLADPGERSLHEFANDDGSKPDGTDAKRDDTSALRNALARGPGIVRVGKGYYRWGDVQIPEGVTLAGQGKATIIRSNGAMCIFRQANVGDWVLRDLVLDGEATGSWRKRKDAGKSGLFTEGCRSFEVIGVTGRNFEGAEFQFTRSKGTNGGCLDRLSATGCYAGVRFGFRGEYLTATKLNCDSNVVGCAIHAGNTSIATSSFCGNIDGMLIEDKENGSHGTVANSLFNHNDRYALISRNVKNGMAISNCCFFYGTLQIEDSAGVNITSSLVSCSVHTSGSSINRFAGNHIIPLKWKFTFGPNEIVDGNFTKEGRWSPNYR